MMDNTKAELADLVAVAIRMMDKTIDAWGFALKAQRQEAVAKQRTGLGMTGLADALMMTGLRFGSVEAAERAVDWPRQISRVAYLASAHLAREKSRVEEEVSDHAARRFRAIHGDDTPLPGYFVTAQDLAPAEHVRMQAAVQRHVDSAISKTVNVPEDISFEAFQAVYLDAYRSGCKGCTT
jgi:ribonucleoside-diphosphate reductase alpha chain